MAMTGNIQTKIAPFSAPNTKEFNQLKVNGPEKAIDANADPEPDFRTILQNSNSDTSRERDAKKTGDLSGAKTDDDFYRMLNERSNPTRAPKNQLGKDDFMKLFVAQMQNQDPMNPSDSSQMAAQMAQFNGLEQMMNVNKTLETMLKSQTQDRAVSMINYVGKEVDVGTGMLKFDRGKVTKSTFETSQPLANAFVEVRDGSGQVIAQQDLGNLMPGEHNLKWDGKLKSGQDASTGLYHFSIVGKTVEGQEVPVAIKSKVKVNGIDLKEEGGAFFTELGKIQLKDITSVGQQGFDENKAKMTIEAAGAPTATIMPNQELPAIDPAQALKSGLNEGRNGDAPLPIPEMNGMTRPEGALEGKPIGDMPASPETALMQTRNVMPPNAQTSVPGELQQSSPQGIKVEVATKG